MSRVDPGTGSREVRGAPSLRERRVAMLRRRDMADRHRLTLEPPTTSFYGILLIVAVFVMLGVIMVLSSSSVVRLQSGSSAWEMFGRQIVWALMGAGGMWYAYSTPYTSWVRQRWLFPAAIVVVGANMVVFMKGQFVNGARAWLDIAGFRFQPSEFMKIVTVLFCANLIAKRHRSVSIPAMVHHPLLGAMGLTAALCALQQDFGGALIFVGIVTMMMVMSGLAWRRIAATMAVAVAAAWVLLQMSSRARVRLTAFLDLDATKEDWGYQVYQALLSIANGGWSGTGIGSGTAKWGYVPEAHTDFIFAVIAEELGLLGTTLVIGGFVLLVLFGIRVALAAPDMTSALIAAGVSAWFGVQAFVNIGGVTGVLPLTGLTLPFLSYGGSSLIASMIAAGMLLRVARLVRT